MRTRILGLDVARALAIVGMVMVHLGPVRVADGGLVGAAYRAAHGRAAIVFVVLAGIGVSLLAGDRSRVRIASARRRLALQAVVLLPAGLALQTLDIDVAVILQYYAVYFLIAAAALQLDDRALVAIAALSATVGPLVVLMVAGAAPELFEPGVPAWSDASRIARDILVTGYYPVVVWTAPLLAGMWIGRRDLRDGAEVSRLLAGGVVVATAGVAMSAALVELAGPATSRADWRQVFTIAAHNEMALTMITATAIATAVIAACVLLARRAPRAMWPLAALGQLALTAYVVHLFVLDAAPQWLIRDTFGGAWASIARFTVVALLIATAYRAVAPRGPFELLLRAPASLVDRAVGRPPTTSRPVTTSRAVPRDAESRAR